MFLAIAILFILGYLFIIFEHTLKIDKAVSAILTGVILWVIIALNPSANETGHNLDLTHVLGEISAILFFLLGAMTIVELVDLHQGFRLISQWVKTKNKFLMIFIIP